MNEKMTSAIQKLVLTDATFNGETVEPTFINFFYGKNGAGKSTIARTIRGNLPGSVEWQSDRPADSYDVLVYDADFIRDNFENYDNLPGVFTIAEENIAVQKQVKEKNDERKKLLEQHGACKGDLDSKSAAKEQALADYQQACWERTFALSLMATYTVSRNLSLSAFFDHQANTPLVSQSAYPTTNTNYGIAVNLGLAR